MQHAKKIMRVCVAVGLLGASGRAQDAAPAARKAAKPSSLAQLYEGYKPDFLGKPLHRGRAPDAEAMKISAEQSFFTLTLLPESDRAYALVAAAKEREAEGQYGEALDIYQRVIDEYPDELFRVSPYGVFVPATQYAQLRMLGFPREALAHYRTKHDARAAEAFNLARKNNSLEGMAHVRDLMLATSYGARAMLLLGDAALDRGHWLEALEYYRMVRDHFPDPEARTPELRLKMAYCRRMLGEKPDAKGKPKRESASDLNPEHLKAFERALAAAKPLVPEFFSQQSSPPHLTADDYHLMPPTDDPLGLKEPAWRVPLPYSRLDFFVYSNPVITRDSVVYRHKNIVYSRSLLNGALRWRNDLGGRVVWQNWTERQYPHEDVLVQDGLVFTTVHQVGPTLVALDEISGQMRWAYGPMVATTREEANMRFEAAPAGGPMTVFAGYIQDNIEGATHTDTEYGVIAFDSVTGRVRWQQHLSRLRPGLFEAGTVRRRNRILSFASPPLYHEGTVYYTTNAGAIAALDALSGRIKWIMRYPYYAHDQNHAVHDATRRFGSGGGAVQYTGRFGPGGIRFQPHSPMFWYPQRPLLVGEDLYVLPVNSMFMYKLDRRTGKVHWTAGKMDGISYFLGPLPGGELLMANSGRGGRVDEYGGVRRTRAGERIKPNHPRHKDGAGPICLLDPATGKTVFRLEDFVAQEPQPSIHLGTRWGGLGHDGLNYQITARPFLSKTGQLIAGGYGYIGYNLFGHFTGLAEYALNEKNRPVTARRRYISPTLLSYTERLINEDAPQTLKRYEALPNISDSDKELMERNRRFVADIPASNEHPSFLPFVRMTFERYGTPFELRFGPRQVEMVFDLDAVKRALAGKRDAPSLFGQAEVAMGEGRLEDAAKLMQACLVALPSEDEDFRVLINQQLYRAHRQLAQGRIRAGDSDGEVAHCLGMSRTATTLGDDLEMRFAISDAYARKGDLRNAALQLQSVVATFGHYGYPVASVSGADRARLSKASATILKRIGAFADGAPQAAELAAAAGLLDGGVPLYFGALSPLEKDLTVRAGEWAARQLNRLRRGSDPFAAEFETMASQALNKASSEEQQVRLPEFPGTRAAQQALESLLKEADGDLSKAGSSLSAAATGRRRLWNLTDMARIGGLTLPQDYVGRLLAPTAKPRMAARFPLEERTAGFEEERAPAWLLLERRGRLDIEPDLIFLGGRVRTRFDNKFLLYAVEAGTGKTRWKATEQRGETRFDEIRLEGLGDEPGFFEAYTYGDTVVVHGQYDVLAFTLADGKLKWRYRVPFAFEIRHSLISGDLLFLAGQSETVALYLGTDDPRGEVVWQEREEGDLYGAPYLSGNRLVGVRSMPFSLTVRYRSTGRLIGRLELPELSLFQEHPLVEKGPEAYPIAHDGDRLVVTDGWYYILLDIGEMRVVWKRLIDNNDLTSEPPMRFEMDGDYLAVVKKDHDVNVIYMLSSRTGEVLWRTDPKDRRTPRPIHSMRMRDGKLYGIRPHAGQGFYMVGLDAKTGKDLFKPNAQTGYGSRPDTALFPALHGTTGVVRIRDRQDFELKAFDLADGTLQHTLKTKAAGDFGEHGRASAAAHNGRLALHGGNDLIVAAPK